MKKLSLLFLFVLTPSLSLAKYNRITVDSELEPKDYDRFLIPKYKTKYSFHVDLGIENHINSLDINNGDDKLEYSLPTGSLGALYSMDRITGGVRFRLGKGSLNEELFQTSDITKASASAEISYHLTDRVSIYLAHDLYKELIFNDGTLTYSYIESNITKTETRGTNITMRALGAYFGVEYKVTDNIIANLNYSQTNYQKIFIEEKEVAINSINATAVELDSSYSETSVILSLMIRYNGNR